MAKKKRVRKAVVEEVKLPAIPVLQVEPTCVPGQVRVWCPFCIKYHIHGVGDGHRVAHCEDGPFKATGYLIVTKLPAPPDMDEREAKTLLWFYRDAQAKNATVTVAEQV